MPKFAWNQIPRFSSQIRGKGRWKLNNSLLRGTEFIEKVKGDIKTVIEEYESDPSMDIESEDKQFNISYQLLWDMIKMKVRGSASQCAGPKCNVDKTEAIWIGSKQEFYGILSAIQNSWKSRIEGTCSSKLDNIMNGNTALHIAVNEGETGYIKFLIKAGIDMNIQNQYGKTALHKVVEIRSTEIVKSLFYGGNDLNILKHFDNTALHNAALNRNTEIVKLLIGGGIDLNIPGQTHCHLHATALHIAVENGNTENVKLLIDAGIDLNIQTQPLYEVDTWLYQEQHIDSGQGQA
ncbi:E3 ubiquitin-protein ligase MIB2-like [Mytilus trossulus]|uniref:E3 ubiquitin-protein ligase MIB2-like n=1 Tax=Mytilus trossulus TaxID=6551 RepID=UPI0030060E37